mmetsp:Transcript_19286/g.53797  ORF Transcript_19286/g.53797 Transcript_19286/m.53797 type:complete len:720 (+) Transcript_19286:180-2339(+)
MAERGKNTGSGYGGSATDKNKRFKAKKEAIRREKGTWTEWENELRKFLSKHPDRSSTVTSSGSPLNGVYDLAVLDTLKQVLRCQAPDWWWKGPQRGMYLLALKVSILITEQYPKAWGDPEDTESAILALEELTETSKILVSSVLASTKANLGVTKRNDGNENDTISAYDSVRNQTAKSIKKQTHEKDMLLPQAVIQLKENALAATKSFIEEPECSMIGVQEYYCQKLRPLAFSLIEGDCFENPKHATVLGAPKGKKKSRGENNSSIQASVTVLWKELSTYPTALPIEYGSSIFVRAMESALHKLRVLIVGPEDTPYANGCFLFDVTMGNDYPNKPPRVKFLTTSSFHPEGRRNDRVRFNPNLYPDGKVCLSLLGTWDGPSWTPKESTLLQVLVSLQSLILGVANPYFNEPGFERTEGSPYGDVQSKAYNNKIRRHTLRVAILPFLQNQLGRNGTANSGSNDCIVGLGCKDSLASRNQKRKNSNDASSRCFYFPEFKEVIEEHFRLKNQVIRKQLKQWLREDSTLSSLHLEYLAVSDQLAEQEQQRVSLGSKSKRSRTTGKATSTASTMPALSVKMKDGAIVVDDEENDLQRAMENSIQTIATDPRWQRGGNKDDAIELVDSDDDENGNEVELADQKLAAVAGDATNKIGMGNHDGGDLMRNGGKSAAGTAIGAGTENVIELAESDDESPNANASERGGQGMKKFFQKVDASSVVDLTDL